VSVSGAAVGENVSQTKQKEYQSRSMDFVSEHTEFPDVVLKSYIFVHRVLRFIWCISWSL